MLGLTIVAPTLGDGQNILVRSYQTSGHPNSALLTPDGRYVLVTVDRPSGSGLDVFRKRGEELHRVAFQAIGSTNSQGVILLPHTKILAVGVSNAGVAFVDLDSSEKGKAKPTIFSQGNRSGSGYLAASPDGKYLFVANEYRGGGSVGVIAIRVGIGGSVFPEELAQIPTPWRTAGLALSEDGTRLYTAGEILSEDLAQRVPGRGVAELQREDCVQSDPDLRRPNGGLYIIDTKKAEGLPRGASRNEALAAVIGVVDAGCSPVREVLSVDGKLYLTARGDNRILVFSASALEGDSARSFMKSIPSGGEAPVGLALAHDNRRMVVANSNRFGGVSGKVTIFDLSDPLNAKQVQTIVTGPFPRNVLAATDGKTMYVTIYGDDKLMSLTFKRRSFWDRLLRSLTGLVQ